MLGWLGVVSVAVVVVVCGWFGWGFLVCRGMVRCLCEYRRVRTGRSPGLRRVFPPSEESECCEGSGEYSGEECDQCGLPGWVFPGVETDASEPIADK